MPDDLISLAQSQFAGAESVGQQRMAALHGGSRDDLVVAPNLWAGFGLVRSGAGTALVGSHEEVADRMAEYHRLGIDHFIMSGQPHLEEAYWFAEGVFPVPAAPRPAGPSRLHRPRRDSARHTVLMSDPVALVVVSSGETATSKTRALAVRRP